jgi:C1A family cysteine protease
MKKQQMKRTAVAFAIAASLGLGFSIPSAYAEPLADDTQYVGGTGGNQNVQALHNYSADEPMAYSDEELPAKYDLRDVDGSNYVTSVKNQGHWGTCWSFATMSALESNMLKQGVTGLGDQSEPDLSELQLAWFGNSPLGEEAYEKSSLLTSPMDLHDQVGEGNSVKIREGAQETAAQQVLNKGGYYTYSLATLASWQGAVAEEDLPYSLVPDDRSEDYSEDEQGPSESYRGEATAYVQNVDQLPNTATFSEPISSSKTDYSDDYVFDSAALDAIKKSLMNNGAVAITYFANFQKQYFNSNYAQYVNKYITTGDDSTALNHAVAIVGWDDTYSKDNFGDLTADPEDRITPPGDGAWIIKNSWGNWGLDGYFYLSYYDMTINTPTVFIYDDAEGTRTHSYDYNYQYDFLGAASAAQIKPNAFGSDAQFANVFTAGSHEKLAAVSVMSVNPNSEVEYKVYKLNDGATDPTDGTLVAQGERTIEYAGYHTIELDEQIDLQAGEKFSVVETVEGRDGSYVPLEIAARDIWGDITNEKHQNHQEAKVSAGQSYISQDGGANWTDAVEITADDIDVSSQILPSEHGNDFEIFSTGNVELKAFTVKASDPDPEPTPDPDVDPDDSDKDSDTDKDADKGSDKQSDKSNASGKSAAKPIVKTGAAVAGVAAVVVVLVVAGVAIVVARSRKEHSGR